MAYKLLIVSSIPVYQINGQFHTLDLWVKDLEKQIECVKKLSLVCPVNIKPAHTTENLTDLPESITLIGKGSLTSSTDYDALTSNHDVIQFGINQPIWDTKVEQNFLKAARRNNTCVISALSSNRAKTLLLNAKSKGILRYIKTLITYTGLNIAISYFTKNCDGVFVVGEGLRELVNPKQKNLHVGTASWIGREDFLSTHELANKADQLASRERLKLCVATRLEPMKGVHLSLDALATIKTRLGDHSPELLILGEGDELDNLKAQSARSGLDHLVTFGGMRAYPDDFFKTIREYDLILLTNLNDEQPRLIFDALSQGLIPICPDSLPFKALNLEHEVYFSRGDALSLAETIMNISTANNKKDLLKKLVDHSKNFTIDAMHEKRANWVHETLSLRSKS